MQSILMEPTPMEPTLIDPNTESTSLRPRIEAVASPVPKELVEAMRQEFRKLVEAEDFWRKMSQMAQLAAQADSLFRTISAAAAAATVPVLSNQAMGINMGYSGAPFIAGPASVSPAPNPEQFGAKAIRELVASVPEVASEIARAIADAVRDPRQTVEAIAMARSRGLEDLANKLERQLTGDAPERSKPAQGSSKSESAEHEHNGHAHGVANGAATAPAAAEGTAS